MEINFLTITFYWVKAQRTPSMKNSRVKGKLTYINYLNCTIKQDLSALRNGPKEEDQFNNIITYTFLSSSTRDAKETWK